MKPRLRKPPRKDWTDFDVGTRFFAWLFAILIVLAGAATCNPGG